MKKHAVITLDYKDWYHTYFPECSVDGLISILNGLDILLAIMNRKNIKRALFPFGEIANLLKDIIRKMGRNGHDIGYHNWEHFRPVTINPQDYREQPMRATKQNLYQFWDSLKWAVSPQSILSMHVLDLYKQVTVSVDGAKEL